MSIVLDSGVVVAFMDAGDQHHQRAATFMATIDDDLVTTPMAVAEMDHFAHSLGAAKGFREDLARGAYLVRWWADAMDESLAIAKKRPDLGLVDASLVALTNRLRTDRIATFDLRHFRTLKTRNGKPFTILPDDA